MAVPASRYDRQNNFFIRLQESPEGKALWKLWTDRKFAGEIGRMHGHVDGYTKREFKRLKRKAESEAERIIQYMDEKGMLPKGEFAKEALQTAVGLMRLEAINHKDKLAAARTVLEYTLAKPASESTVTVKTAEDFLSDLAKDAGIE